MKSGLLVLLCLTSIVFLTSSGCGNHGSDEAKPTDTTSSPDYFSRSLGLDVLALQHPLFNIQALLDETPKHYSIGFLDFTFGTSLKPVEDVLEHIKPKYLRVHLLNGSCVFNQNCGTYSPVENYTFKSLTEELLEGKATGVLNHLTNRTIIYCSLAKQFPKTKFLLSPMLEHRLSQEAWVILADTVLKTCPDIQIVNNWHDGFGERYKGAFVELHGEVSTGMNEDINSLDGDDIFEIDVLDWLERTKTNLITFAWTEKFNCREPGNFIDPRYRTFCPTAGDFKKVVELLSEP